MLRISRVVGAAAGVLAAAALSFGGAAFAQTLRVEAESFVPPDGNATMGSGPNASAIVSVDQNAAASGGFTIGWFGSWDWLEYNVTAPADGVYNLSLKYADADTNIDPLPVVITVFTSGSQQSIGNIHTTPTWAYTDYTTITAAPDDASPPLKIPLKAGVNRFRISLRPDFVAVGAMNVDYYEFTKTADPYPSLVAVTGTVTTNITGTPLPLPGALVSDTADYHTADHVTRTDANGAYTLWVPAGSSSITAFANGFQKSTSTVTAPGTANFNMTSGRWEAEILDATNPGPEPDKGIQPAYDTQHGLSNNGELVNSLPGKYAEYKHVIAPADGVYDLSIHYSSLSAAVGDPGYLTWTVNTLSTVKMTYTATSTTDFLTYADSAPILVTLKKGLNTLRLTDANAGTGGNPATPSANIDYFTIAPSTQPHGVLKIVVTNSNNGSPIGGAAISIPTAAPLFTAVTAADGTVSIPVPPGTYQVTASKSGASPVTVSAGPVADGQTLNVPIQLSIAGVAVEAEDFAAGGPATPAATITDVPSASGTKVVTGFTGAYLQEWLQWNVNVTEDGLYRMTLQYSVPPDGDSVHPVYPIDMTLSVMPSTFHAHITNIPRTENGDTYASYDLQDDSGTAILVPLKAGANTVRLSMAAGTINLDYIQFAKLQAYPTLRTFSGTIRGTDGTGTAPIAGATVWTNNNGLHTSLNEAPFATTTDAAGHYTINSYTGGNYMNASANGFVTPAAASFIAASTTTKDLTLTVNNPNNYPAPTEQFDAFILTQADARLATNEGMITFTQPGASFTWNVSVPRAGTYQVGMYYSSGWNSGDGLPVKTTWTVNGAPQTVNFDKTTAWTDFQYNGNIATIPLNAGGNTIRVDFVDAGANIVYATLHFLGGLPTTSTDINGSGKTDVVDAVLYARRINGLDPGPKPDLTGDGAANAADVMRILRVAGGLS